MKSQPRIIRMSMYACAYCADAKAREREGEKIGLEMDETGAVDVARGKLERRRQEAYKARAAATVKIQRWYRRCLAKKNSVRSRAGYEHLSDGYISNQPSTEESYIESRSATISFVSEQESDGDSLWRAFFINPVFSSFNIRCLQN